MPSVRRLERRPGAGWWAGPQGGPPSPAVAAPCPPQRPGAAALREGVLGEILGSLHSGTRLEPAERPSDPFALGSPTPRLQTLHSHALICFSSCLGAVSPTQVRDFRLRRSCRQATLLYSVILGTRKRVFESGTRNHPTGRGCLCLGGVANTCCPLEQVSMEREDRGHRACSHSVL